MVIYNEPVEIIERAVVSVADVVDIAYFIVHKAFDLNSLKFLIGYDFPVVFMVSDLDNTIVEEWRNLALEHCYRTGSVEFVIILDPDEYVDSSLRLFLNKIKKDIYSEPNIGGYLVNRNNIERDDTGKKFVSGKNYPDPQLRIFRTDFRYSGEIHKPVRIHPAFKVERAVGTIIHDKRHEPYEEWLRKLKLYRSKGGKDNVRII